MFARGDRAWGQCGKCGLRALANTLVADGYFPHLRVHPGCRDDKHPQEQPVDMEDPIAIQNPAPNADQSVAIPEEDVRWGESQDDFGDTDLGGGGEP